MNNTDISKSGDTNAEANSRRRVLEWRDLRFGQRHPDEPVTLQTPEGPITETKEGFTTCKVTSKPADEVQVFGPVRLQPVQQRSGEVEGKGEEIALHGTGQERFVHVLKRIFFLTDDRCQGLKPDGPSLELVYERQQDPAM